MSKLFLIVGSIYGMMGVAIGAFGAHALKAILEQSGRTETFETAVKYQFYHAFLLLFIGYLGHQGQDRLLHWSGWAAMIGTFIFSTALYLICFTGIKAFGAIAPVGGTLLVVSWALLAFYFFKRF